MKRRGFSLLEVVVAFSVLSMGILSVLTLLTNSIKMNFQNTNRIIAVSLAEEVPIVLRNIRDSNILEGIAWNDSIVCADKCVLGYDEGWMNPPNCDDLFAPNRYELPGLGAFVSANQNDVVLYIGSSTAALGYFQMYGPAFNPNVCSIPEITIFKRWITIAEEDVEAPFGEPEKLIVTVTVEWSDTSPHTYQFTSELFDISSP